MCSSAKVRRFVLLGVSGILVFVLTAFASASTNQQDLDLSTVILRLDDLPARFAPLSGSDLTRLESALDIYQGAMQGASDAKIQNITGFRTSDPLNSQIVVSRIVAPLSPAEQLIINQQLANPDAAIEQLSRGLGGGEASALRGAEDIGQSRLGFSVTIGSVSMRMDYVVARRGPVIIEVAYMYLESQTPLTSAVELARILDDRAIDVVGGETAPAFRTAGPLVPELTTYIPTPLDVSTKPSVIGTNLFLAALLMLPFAVAAEIVTRILGEHEEALRRRVRVVDWVARMQMKLESVSGSRLKRTGLQDADALSKGHRVLRFWTHDVMDDPDLEKSKQG